MNEPISQLFNGIKVVQGTCAAWTRGGCRAAAASTEAGRGRMAASNTSWARRPRRVASADNGEVSDEYEVGDDGDEPGEATMVRAGVASLREAVSTATDRHGSSRRRRRRTRWRRRGRSRVTVRRGCLGISRLLRSTVRSEETRDRTSVDGSRARQTDEWRGGGARVARRVVCVFFGLPLAAARSGIERRKIVRGRLTRGKCEGWRRTSRQLVLFRSRDYQ